MTHFLAILFFAAAGLRGQSISIEEYEPKSTLVVPQHPTPRAKYPVIDVHNHQGNCLTRECIDKLLADMDSINVRVMVNLSGGYGDRLEKVIAAQKGQAAGRLVVFANLDFTDLDAPGYPERVAAQLERDIKAGARGLKFFKNFGMDLKDSKGQRVHVDDARFDKAFDVCAKYNVPVLIHTAEPKAFFDPMDKYNERWLELKLYPRRARPSDKYPSWETLIGEQHALFKRHPKTKFIDAHLGWLGGNLDELGRLLDRLPNVYTEISAVVEELCRQPRYAKQWFIKYQDRVMFGKDTWRAAEYGTYFRIFETADEYFDHDRKYHGMWKAYGLDLPDEVLKKLYYKTALKVIPDLKAEGFPQ